MISSQSFILFQLRLFGHVWLNNMKSLFIYSTYNIYYDDCAVDLQNTLLHANSFFPISCRHLAMTAFQRAYKYFNMVKWSCAERDVNFGVLFIRLPYAYSRYRTPPARLFWHSRATVVVLVWYDEWMNFQCKWKKREALKSTVSMLKHSLALSFHTSTLSVPFSSYQRVP